MLFARVQAHCKSESCLRPGCSNPTFTRRFSSWMGQTSPPFTGTTFFPFTLAARPRPVPPPSRPAPSPSPTAGKTSLKKPVRLQPGRAGLARSGRARPPPPGAREANRSRPVADKQQRSHHKTIRVKSARTWWRRRRPRREWLALLTATRTLWPPRLASPRRPGLASSFCALIIHALLRCSCARASQDCASVILCVYARACTCV